MPKQILTYFVALILGLMAATLFAGIGILFIVTSSTIPSHVFAVLFIGSGFFLGYKVYITVLSQGIISFMTSVNASPDFDNVEPSANSNHKKYQLNDFIAAAKNSENQFKGGFIRVWGNGTLKGMQNNNKISEISSPETGLLQLSFSNGNILRIKNPQNIFEGETYLKVLDCDKLEWDTSNGPNNSQQTLAFKRFRNKIEVNSNSWINKNNFQPNDPAVLIYK